MKKSLLVAGVEVFPLLTPLQTQDRPFVEGEDEQGSYVACRLSNAWRSPLYDWYVFVSPEDVPLMEEYTWCGNIYGPNHAGIEVRRRERVDGKTYSIQLSRVIWERMGESEVRSINRVWHLLDFRRQGLSSSSLRRSCRGITWRNGTWQVQITINKKSTYIGQASNSNEGYRMYNRYLRKLKEEFPHDHMIRSKAYNDVTPQF